MNRRYALRAIATAAAGFAVGCGADDTSPPPAPPMPTNMALPSTTRVREMVSTTTTTPDRPPTVEEFFAEMNKALDTGADVQIGDLDSVLELLDGLETAGYTVQRGDVAVVTHPDGRTFRLVP